MKGKLLMVVLTAFCVSASTAAAEEKMQPDKKTEVISKEDQEIVKMMETLNLLDLVENINLLEDLDVIIEGESDEKEID